MKKTTIYYIFILNIIFPLMSLSQGIDNLWLMGYASWYGRPYGGINLNFQGGVLDTSWQDRKMNFNETNSVICNKNGDLLCSSNGVWIANAFNDTILNGSGLNPSTYTVSNAIDSDGLYITQANLIIPFPADSNKYYLFHQTIDDYPGTYCSLYLYYSVIDMTGDSGKGAVIDKNHILLKDSLIAGGLTACKHANGRDWWLTAYQYRTDTLQFASSSKLYYKFLITPSGILEPDTQSIGLNNAAIAGQTVFSPDGKYFANYLPTGVDVFNFDRCTGLFSPKTYIALDSTYSWGVAFSPNSQVLYLSEYNHVFQYDMNESNIPNSQKTILTWDGTFSPDSPLATLFYLQQIAPDGKIYIICPNSTDKIHVINDPDVLGIGCNACQHCIQLPALNAFTIANHPNYFLVAEKGSVCDSLESVQSLSVKSSKLEIYPNPVALEDVTFTYNVSSEKGVLSIYNIEGKEVVQYHLPQWSSIQHLKLPKLSGGIYLARLVQGDVISEVKFIKE